MELESPGNHLTSIAFLSLASESTFPWHSNAMYFLLVSIPYYLLNLPKYLWFEAESFHRARHYLPQLFSFSFLICLIECSLFSSFSTSSERDGSSEAVSLLYERSNGFGSLNREDLLCRGEVFRLLSHLFYHFNLSHLAANLRWQIWYCGYYNVLYGPWAFLLIWFVGGMFGAINHMLSRDEVLSGANASICAVHCSYLVWILYHAEETPSSFIRTYLRNCNFAIVSFYLLAVMWLTEDDRLSDRSAQFGGVLMGLLLGTFLFRPLSDNDHDQYGHEHNRGEVAPQKMTMLQRTSLILAIALIIASLLWLGLETRPAICERINGDRGLDRLLSDK